MNAAQRKLVPRRLIPLDRRQLPLFAHVAIGSAIALGLLVGLRRLLLSRVEPLPLAPTLATAVVLLLITVTIRRIAVGEINRWLPTLALACWALACSYPGSQVAAWMIWIAVIASDFWLAHLSGATEMASAPRTAPSLTGDAPAEQLADETSLGGSPLGGDPLDSTASMLEEPADDGQVVLQHVVRVRDPNGQEYIHATLRGEMEAGARRTTVHVGFCPPFMELPQVEAEVIEGPAGVAKVVQSLHHGAQIEIELDTASLEPATVTVEVAAYLQPAE